MKRAILFCLLSILVSGCAGSGAGGGVSHVRPFGPAPESVPAPEPRPGFFFEPPDIGEHSSGVIKGMSYYKYTPPPPEPARRDEEEPANPYLLPAVAVPDPGSDASLEDLPPARAFDRSWLVAPVSPCEDFFHNYLDDNIVRSEFETVRDIPAFLPGYTGSGTPSAENTPSFHRCARARVPGLTPLYDAVLANVSARADAGESVRKIGVVIDRLDHGLRVVDTAEAAVPRELFHYASFSGYTAHIKALVRDLGGLSDSGLTQNPTGVDLVSNPIVNLSFADLFSTEAAGGEYVNAGDVLNGGALVVTGTGNWGDGGGPYGSPGQPAHNVDGMLEVHERTGSLLMVAGSSHNGVPLTDGNGFHLRYTGENLPDIHIDSNRCGDARDFCVLAPYEIFRSVDFYEVIGGSHYMYKGVSGAHRAYYGASSEQISRHWGTSYSTPLVFGTLVNIRYVWPHLTNRQLVKLSCATAIDLGKRGNDAVYGCGLFSVSDIWQPTGELVDNPEELFSLSVADGAMSVGGASFGEEVTVVGYENNEFRRDYELSVPASSSGAPLRVEPTVSYGSLKTMLRFRGNGSVPVGYEGTAAHLFRDAFLFLKGVQGGSAVGVSHASGFSVAFERETDSFFGSYGSGSYKFGDTNKVVASFDREFDLGGTYGLGVKVAAAYGEMEPAISLVKSAKGTAKSAGVSLARRKGNFESKVEMNYNTGLKGTVSVQRREYDLKPLSEAAVMLRMRFVM